MIPNEPFPAGSQMIDRLENIRQAYPPSSCRDGRLRESGQAANANVVSLPVQVDGFHGLSLINVNKQEHVK